MKTEEFRQTLYNEAMLHLRDFGTQSEWETYYDGLCTQLLKHMEEKNKLLNIFENPKNKGSHQHFWEVLVGNLLSENGIDVKRDPREAAPDYFFEVDGKRIHIEAKAPTDGTNEQFKPRGIPLVDASLPYEASFEDGIISGTNSILRFTSILSSTVNQIESSFIKNKTVSINDRIVVAVNGNDVVKNMEMHQGNFKAGNMSYGFNIICALFGLDGQYYLDLETNQFFYSENFVKKGKVSVPNRFFCAENKCPIDGIIYSNVNNYTYLQGDKPFLFIPNPQKEDIGHYFPFCNNIGYPLKRV